MTDFFIANVKESDVLKRPLNHKMSCTKHGRILNLHCGENADY